MPNPLPAPRCHALVPCAGVGARSGTALPKQYALLAGRPLVAHTLAALAGVARLHSVLLVLAPGDEWFEPAALGWVDERLRVCRNGGATRAATVRAGLTALREQGADDDDWVLAHDAARCLLQAPWVDGLIDACADDAVGGLLALPLADTLKQAVGDRVQATLPRADKWLAQTPQMFRLGLLAHALDAAGSDVTDEASAIEALGLAPMLVRGHPRNLKVTWPEDFALAEYWLAHQVST